ncbi:ABC transporter ATP-binding protein [Demequina sp. SYSU T00039]|uniref:ABC transporter ATP-binding protein n=1 Tax=Demequina lignilytica TaxID=3051663 RepID=A0AAW7M9B6_9MICO|nr:MULTISPECIES: ABC transporter ATP-binding protein [unclassified Demequina]MDN4478085.1 ABC transporter ATP-binding protein [Demequina sp. SYSU T00039-1]MDN4488465.1 ABC transporter ATP-binding protein [Demequina sp. SYSU T00039]MDN4489988.1 ABC transporter ATP-binding protein [Demequina sp. SYSU T00068]
MTDAAISIAGLHKHYGDLRAVDGLDLEIPRGEVFALLGPNGAGKSTTVEILEGFRKRTAGEVSVLGIDPHHATKEWRTRVGVMLQSTSARSSLTAREALLHTSRYYPNPRDVDATLDEVGLTEKANAKPQTLSGGQQRRLDVALAVIGNPDLVFLDEPTTGFDPEARRRFWRLIEGLSGDGTTVVLTTHYLDEADHLADRIGIIASGRLVALDTPDGLRSRATDARITWTEGGEPRTEETPTPAAFLRDLLGRIPGEVEGLRVTHPSLEDVYLRLVDDVAEVDAAAEEEPS